MPPLSEPAEGARRLLDESAQPDFEQIEALCAAHPDDQSLHAIMIFAYAQESDFQRAQTLLDARMQGPASATLYGAAAYLATLLAKPAEADAHCRQGDELDPGDFLVRVAKCFIADLRHEDESATAHFQFLRGAYPDSAFVYSLGFSLLLGSSDAESAKNYLDSAPGWFKQTVRYCSDRSMLALMRHDMIAVEREVRRGLEIDPEAAELWGRLAMALYETGRLAESERAAHRSLAICPHASTALRTLSFVYGALGFRDREEEFQRRAAAAVPMNAECEPAFDAAAHIRAKDFEGAIAGYRRQMRAELPAFAASARKSLLRLLVDLQRWDQARELLSEIDQAGDRHPAIEALRHRITLEDGRRSEALAGMRALTAGEDLQTELWPMALALYARAKSEADIESVVTGLCAGPLGNATHLAQCINLLLAAGYRPQAWHLANHGNGWCKNAPPVLRAGINVSAVHGDFIGALRRYRRLPLGRRQGLSVSKIITSCLLRQRCA